jgi:hypothetical protein
LKRDILGLQDSLKHKYYSTPALTPVTNGNIDIPSLSVSRIKANRKKLKWKVKKEDLNNIKYFVVYSYSQDEEFNPDLAEQIISTTGLNYMPLNKSPKSSRQKRYYRVSAVDKFGNEGEISEAVKK